MSTRPSTRRAFLQQSAAVCAACTVPYWMTTSYGATQKPRSANDRPRVALIGCGGQGRGDAQLASAFGDIVAVCDVDAKHVAQASDQFGGKPDAYGDYRQVLDRNDVDVVINATPDHWHTPINVSALKAGKDLYAEKPLTLTIDEGKILRRVVEETGRIVQVGTQQRSVKCFQTAIELVRNGRVGQLQEVTVTLPYWSTKGGPFAKEPVPAELNWDMYQGQAPAHDYCAKRTHFIDGGGWRWWYEYAGGIITDWGNHHIDIAHWGMDMELSGPLTIEGTATFPNEGLADCYSTPDRFDIRMTYPGGLELHYVGADNDRDGIMFRGDRKDHNVFVNRGGAYGKPVEELANNPLPDSAWRVRPSDNHMGNFFQCLKTREKPVSPVEIQHRTITACHLANLAVRLQRKLTWDPVAEQFVGDDDANAWQKREQRAPYMVDDRSDRL